MMMKVFNVQQRYVLNFYRLCFWLILLFVSQQSLVPQPAQVFENSWDKALHFTAWFGVSVAAYLAYGYHSRGLKVILAVFAYAVLVECGQLWVPGRFFSLLDMLANGLGCLLAVLAIVLLERWVPLPWQQRLSGLQRRKPW
ncbi:VanZ like protein [Sinobacterium caligoides]|uniref:VanZ like protein n=1 Tax=Sinobacterium caligoides TaxID=933926 RepID=A0A3N2DZJ3_9GAMM|nr:VanZ family protein [Sinobacterium caligoides]ROS05062.1 VanZ like protein [Sinobacterium caligoides]